MIELNKVYNEDCLTGMERIPDGSIDCIICDLPYGVLNKGNDDAKWDHVIPFGQLWLRYERIIKDNGAIVLFGQGMFSANLMVSNPKLWRYNLIWQKGMCVTGFLNSKKMPLRNHEDIMIFYKSQPTYNPQMETGYKSHKRSRGMGRNRCYGSFDPTKHSRELTTERFPKSIIDIDKEYDGNLLHPTQKPVNLIRWLVATYTNEGDTVLDNCIGSGTTAIACIREKRNFIGFEMNPDYYRICSDRIDNELRQLTLF